MVKKTKWQITNTLKNGTPIGNGLNQIPLNPENLATLARVKSLCAKHLGCQPKPQPKKKQNQIVS